MYKSRNKLAKNGLNVLDFVIMGYLQGFLASANLDSSVEHRSLHSDGLFKSGLSEEFQVFILTCYLALGLVSRRTSGFYFRFAYNVLFRVLVK